MYKVYNKDIFLGDAKTLEEVEEIQLNYFNKINEEISKDIEMIDKIENILKNVFPKPEAMTDDKYLEFLKNNFPEFINLLDEFKNSRTEDIVGIFISNPKLSEVGLKIKADNKLGYNLVSLNNYYLKLKRLLPNEYTFRVEEI